jgi:hypothetical protein
VAARADADAAREEQRRGGDSFETQFLVYCS